MGQTLEMIHSTQPIFHREVGPIAKHLDSLASTFCLTDLRDGCYSQKLARIPNYKAITNKLPMTSPLCRSGSLSMKSSEVRDKDNRTIIKVANRERQLRNKEVTGQERPKANGCHIC